MSTRISAAGRRARAFARCAALAFVWFTVAPNVAAAQAPAALPTAPGAAEKAGSGGFTGARASLPGDNGSPLEPYLFLFILAGGGIIGWLAALGTDVRVRRGRQGVLF